MIFHEQKIIFLHIGKTAGSSIEKFFAPAYRNPDVADYESLFGWDPYRKIFLQHSTLETVRSSCDHKIYKNYFKFSIVRNPYERIISVFNYGMIDFVKKYGSFRAFIMHLPLWCDLQTAAGGGHLSRQVDYIFDIENQKIDFFGKFENLEYDLSRLSQCLNLHRPIVLPLPQTRHHLAGKMTVYDLDDKMIQVIQRVYRDDFERLEYSKILPEPTRKR